MKIGIGVSLNPDSRAAAREAVAQARRTAADPTLAIVFGSIHLQQEEIYVGLMEAGIDPAILFGGSSYAEISPAGVTYKSVVVLLIELPEAKVKTVSVPLQSNPNSAATIFGAGGTRPDDEPGWHARNQGTADIDLGSVLAQIRAQSTFHWRWRYAPDYHPV